MDDDFEIEEEMVYTHDTNERKFDEKDFSKKLNQPKLNKHEMDDLFLLE